MIFLLLIFIYICIIIKYFVFEFFDFHIWINFLFTSSQKILALSGYEAFVEPNLLIGENGSIYMSRDCLGFQTMFLFAIVVFLTGNKKHVPLDIYYFRSFVSELCKRYAICNDIYPHPKAWRLFSGN